MNPMSDVSHCWSEKSVWFKAAPKRENNKIILVATRTDAAINKVLKYINKLFMNRPVFKNKQ